MGITETEKRAQNCKICLGHSYKYSSVLHESEFSIAYLSTYHRELISLMRVACSTFCPFVKHASQQNCLIPIIIDEDR